MTDITELAPAMKAAAEKATPGNWRYLKTTPFMDAEISAANHARVVNLLAGDVTEANSAFIALANPANILALVEALEKAQQYAKERDAENQDLMLTVGRLRVEREELESRTVKLPDLRQIVSGDRYVWSDGVYNYSQDVKAALTAAGIKWEFE